MPRLRPKLAVLCALGFVAVLSGCSGGSPGSAGSGSGVGSSAPSLGLPDATVTDVRTGQQSQLASLRVPGRPMLVWFWAPH